MRVLVAPDKFKGSLTAREVAARVAAGIGAEAPGVEVEQVPVADGGDGTLDAAVAAGYTRVEVRAQGPTGEPVTTAFAARDDVAVVEMADVSGLALLMPDRLDALGASSYGTGEVVRAALDHGCREIVLGIGGSASTDGGAGMLQALGARLLSSGGQELGRGGAALADLARLDLSGLHPALAETARGGGERRRQPAARPQRRGRGVRAAEGRFAVGRRCAGRGAGPLGRRRRGGGGRPHCRGRPGGGRWGGAARWRAARAAPRDRAGAGAAGGVGFAAMAVLGAEPQSGIGLVLDLVGFADPPRGRGPRRHRRGLARHPDPQRQDPRGRGGRGPGGRDPVVTVSGRVALTADQIAGAGIRRAYALTDIESDPDRCFTEAGPLLQELARTLARDWLKEDT